VETLSNSIDDISKHVKDFEPSFSSSSLLDDVKQELYDEIRCDKFISHDIDTVYLVSECENLRKANSVLQGKLNEFATKYNEQREKFHFMLLQMELFDVTSQTFEVEQCLSDVRTIKSWCPLRPLGEKSDQWSSFPPQFRAQMLKLSQCQLWNEHTRHALQLVLSEKEALEVRLDKISGRQEEKNVLELERKVKE